MDPVPSTVPLRAARGALSELLDVVEHGGERIAITRRGETAAVLISPADLKRLTARAMRKRNRVASR